jgi:5-methylcytosine-specific restriction endonuclease McrA
MTEGNVLVLNQFWQAVNVCSIKRAVCLLYRNHARVVTAEEGSFGTFSFEDWKDLSSRADLPENECINAIKFKIRIPRIILLVFYDRLPVKEVKFTRKNIYDRDGNRCQYCGRRFEPKELNLDHVIPQVKGGKTTWDNVVCSCIKCNMKKGNKSLKEAGMKLIKKPRKPRWQNFILVKFRSGMDKSWRHFIDLAYWNVELSEEIK